MNEKVLPVAFFRKEAITASPRIVYPARSLAVPPLPQDPKLRAQWFDSKNVSIFNINDIFKDFATHKEAKFLFTHINNGIGDIIAFSSVAEYLNDYTLTVFGSPDLKGIYKWFLNDKIILKNFHDVIFKDYSLGNILTKYRYYARLRLEYSTVQAGSKCWYEAMFDRIGVPDIDRTFKRPMLVNRRISDKIPVIKGRNTILITHRSSCQIRSSNFEDFYIPISKALPSYKIYVHEVNLSKVDKEFIKTNNVNVTVIPPSSIDDYLLDVFDAKFVVGTDSAAVHFREGVRKPAIAVYGAFSAASRMSGYKYVKYFDCETGCKHQPCLIHEKFKGEVCHNATRGDVSAPCQSGKAFQEQLYQFILKNY